MAYGTRQAVRVDELLKKLDRYDLTSKGYEAPELTPVADGEWVRYGDIANLLHQACIEAERD